MSDWTKGWETAIQCAYCKRPVASVSDMIRCAACNPPDMSLVSRTWRRFKAMWT